jgi:hypothetical protein
MLKTPKSQRKAVTNYNTKKVSAGYKKLWLWIKPEWKSRIKEVIQELESYKG